MKTRIFLLTALMAASAALAPAASAWNSSKYHISDMAVTRENGQLAVTMTVNPKDYRLSLNKLLRLEPVVKSKTTADSIVLPAVLLAGRNIFYTTMRDGKADATLIRSGSKEAYHYAAATPWQPWMDDSEVTLQSSVTGCCGADQNEDDGAPVATLDFVEVPFQPVLSFAEPVADGPKTRKLEGKAYVSFPVNRTEIYPNYMINPQELRKITSSIDTVSNDPDAIVKTITLTGFASPEGPYLNNVRLASGRTEAVKEYVRKQYDFPASVFKTHFVPEDWDGLRDSIAASSFADREQMLDFIDNVHVAVEKRNDEFMKRFPKSYKVLLKEVYPWLRHTNYLIDYEIRQFNNLDDILRIYREDPSKLSLNEFYRAANNYPVGSKEFNDVMETALAYNKDSREALINAANVSVGEGDLKRARVLLSRCGDAPKAVYGLAVVDALEGKLAEAEAGFEKAKAAGVAEADAAISQVKELRARTTGINYAPEQ